MKPSKVQGIIKELNFNKLSGIIPAVIQDFKTGKMLMVGFMNKKALEKTLREGRATYFSRTRREFWTKGATSGNFQLIKEVWTDCDNDTLLIKVKQIGHVCHTGHKTCFYKRLLKDKATRHARNKKKK